MKIKSLLAFSSLLLFGGAWVMGEDSIKFTFDKQSKSWVGSYSIDHSTGHNQPPSLKVVDSSKKGGAYAISAPIAITAGKKYQVSGWCKTDGKVTSGAVIYLRMLDTAGKTLKCFSSNQTKSANWIRLQCIIPAKSIPAKAVSARIMLQAARGAAKETGSAWFDDISFSTVKSLPRKQGQVEISRKIFIKELPSARPIKFHGRTVAKTAPIPVDMKSYAWELSWRNFRKLSSLLLKDDGGNIKKLNLSYWDDAKQKWISAGNFDVREISGTGYAETMLVRIPETRRLLVKFDAVPDITDLKLYTVPEIKENWKASWIWFTQKRIEHIKRYFRKEFVVNGKIDDAFFQGTGDDGVVFYMNGKRITSCGDWSSPVQSNITKYLVQGKNVIAAYVKQDRYAAGVLAEIDINYDSGMSQKIITDESWKSTDKPGEGWLLKNFDDSSWLRSVRLGIPPDGVWGVIAYKTNSLKKQIKLENNPLKSTLKAGQTVSVKFDLKVPDGIDKKTPVYLIMTRNGVEFMRKKLWDIESALLKSASGKASFETTFNLNPVLCPGKYEFSLQIPYCSVVYAGKEWKPVVYIENSLKPELLNVAVKKLHGIPTMHINGVPHWSMFYTASPKYDMEKTNHQAFADAGIKLVHCYANPQSPAEGKFDFTAIDKAVLEIIENNPDALIVMKPCFRDCMPVWFLKKYPEEASVLDAGRVLSKPSLASEKWRLVAGDMLKKMIRHINNSPYADKVIGYFVREGEEGQWMHYWGSGNPNQDNTLSDYSKPMRAYFRKWLRNKYSTVEALRRSWGDKKVTFESAEVPSRLERIAPNSGVFRCPEKNRPAIDYAEALSDVICDGIIYYGKIVKEETHNKSLMMAFFGHIIDLGAHFLGEQVGYLKQRRAIDSPYIDYYAGPISYAKAFRDISGVGSFDYPAPACLRLQNKIWLNEDDVRTHLTEPAGYAYSVRAPNQTDQVIAREFAKALCAGAGLYLYNLSSGNRYWYDDRQTLKTIGKLNKIGQDAVKDNLQSVSELAVIVSDRSLLYLRSLKGHSKVDGIVLQSIGQREQISRIGAPFDEYLVDDFLDPAMPDYKLYIFLNAYYMTDDERKAVVNKLKKKHSTALWFYAPGYITDNGISLDAASNLTGIKIEKLPGKNPGRIKIAGNNSLLPGQQGTFGMPSGMTVKPLFFSCDRDSKSIGTLQVNKKPGFVVKTLSGFTSYYCTIPAIPAKWIREIARKAGVHIYLDSDDALYACHDYLAVHTSRKTGKRNIKLIDNAEIIQLYPEVRNIGKTDRFSFESKTPQTRIFKIKH
jgi:hypothetical protein